jgi:glycosyltransferase involved in cell wall biosynthesis
MTIEAQAATVHASTGVHPTQSDSLANGADHSRVVDLRSGASNAPARRQRVSLVIPARNEARNIAWVLEQIADEVDEVILVDGNSTDVTLITAQAYRPDVRIVPQEGVGKGSALRTGFLAATGDLIVMMDADGSMSPSEIHHYLHFLTHGYDFVKGSRFISGGASLDITPFRRLGNRFLLGVFNTLYDANLSDLCYGFCAFHRRYLEHLNLSATGFEIEAEMTVRAMQAGLRMVEVPSLELPRRTGASNLHAIRDGVRVLRTVLRGHRTGLSGRCVQAVVKGRTKTGQSLQVARP